MLAQGAHFESESCEASFCHLGSWPALGLKQCWGAAGTQQIGPRQQQLPCVAEAVNAPCRFDRAAFSAQLLQLTDLVGMTCRTKAIASL